MIVSRSVNPVHPPAYIYNLDIRRKNKQKLQVEPYIEHVMYTLYTVWRHKWKYIDSDNSNAFGRNYPHSTEKKGIKQVCGNCGTIIIIVDIGTLIQSEIISLRRILFTRQSGLRVPIAIL